MGQFGILYCNDLEKIFSIRLFSLQPLLHIMADGAGNPYPVRNCGRGDRQTHFRTGSGVGQINAPFHGYP